MAAGLQRATIMQVDFHLGKRLAPLAFAVALADAIAGKP